MREPTGSDGEDLRRLGDALGGRIDDVLSLIDARNNHAAKPSEEPLDDIVRNSFERIGRSSTAAVATWMAGGDPRAGKETGQEAWDTYGQLAAQSAATLNEVIKRCLRWRDSVADVLRDSASELGVCEAVADQGRVMVQRTLDVTLVRICESFEVERRRTDEELARRQEELAFMSTHDALTGLPNRTLILDRGEQMLAQSRRQRTPMAALFIDIDNFKNINDTLGHNAGDELLRAVTARLDGVVRETDALGRIGGDEFVVIAHELSLGAGPELIAERLLEALKEPFDLLGKEQAKVSVTASIGIAMGERATAGEFLRDADTAMYRAKWSGKNRYVVFDTGMQDAIQDMMELEGELRHALENDEFFLVYQPTFDLRDMSPTGMEALIRWNSTTKGLVQPNDFIPVLEKTGLIVDVGRWVLGEACRQAATWRHDGHAIGIAVNVSALQLDTDKLVSDVEEVLSESGLEPDTLTLEITETALMRNIEDTVRRLAAIKQLGVRIAIDDFGTGYSSLSHLQQFPVDALKIDRSFITRLTQNPEGETLIHSLVQLGKALSIETLAEGIEKQQELTLLQGEQCDSGQGFLFARPLDVDAAETFLQSLVKTA